MERRLQGGIRGCDFGLRGRWNRGRAVGLARQGVGEPLDGGRNRRHAQALEEVRARLTRENDQTLAAIRTEFDIFRERFLKTQHEKLLTYRLGADLITGLLAAFDRFGEGRMSAEEAGRIRDDFNRERMRAYAYLAMLAPQPVMDAFDAVVDYLFAVMEAPTKYDWKHLRALSLALLNRIREDVGLDKTPIEYRGPR